MMIMITYSDEYVHNNFNTNSKNDENNSNSNNHDVTINGLYDMGIWGYNGHIKNDVMINHEMLMGDILHQLSTVDMWFSP